jgi:2'-hydroxyisoflavone reductase
MLADVRTLVLGGTVFVGRHIVDEALRRGHDVTVFSRGKHGAPPVAVEHVRGDRRGDLSALSENHWDLVIDTSGYRPQVVAHSARALSGRVGHYTFISSLSVYPDHSGLGLDESAPVVCSWAEDLRPSDPAAYGALKGGCEEAVREAFGERGLVLRAGLLVGPHDQSERFGYWPARIARGGRVLAPTPREQPIQVIDARDHAAFALDMAERGTHATFNVTSPPGAETFSSMLAACPGFQKAEIVWITGELLTELGVRPWSELPLWTGNARDMAGTMLFSAEAAEKAGLRCRVLAETARDVLDWERARGQLRPRGGQLPELKERWALMQAQLRTA